MRSLSAAWLQEHLQILVAISFTSVGFVVCSEVGRSFQTQTSSFREPGLCAIAQRRSLLVAAIFSGELMVSMGCQPVRQRRISKTKRRSHIEPRGKPYEPLGLAESIFFKCWSVDDDIFAWPKWKRWKGPAYHHLTIVLVLVVFEHTILLWNVWKCVGIVTEATARQNQRLSREGSIRGSVRKSMRSMGSALSQLPEEQEQEEQDVLLHR